MRLLRDTLGVQDPCVAPLLQDTVTLLWKTLVGHSSGRDTLLDGSLLWDTFVGHFCGTLLWDTRATLLWDTVVGHSRGTLLQDTLAGHSCGNNFEVFARVEPPFMQKVHRSACEFF